MELFNNIPYINYLLPPIIGAIIGYLTNSLAIKMLFKPYKKWNILGARIPFTPGIIPRHRDELASNIGKVVGSTLLNKETLENQLLSNKSYKVLHKLISKNVDEVLSKDSSSLYNIIPKELEGIFLSNYSNIKKKLKPILLKAILKKDLKNTIKPFVNIIINDLSNKQLSKVISKNDIKLFLDKLIITITNSFSESYIIDKWIDDKFEQLKVSKVKVGDIIPDIVVKLVYKFISKELPTLIENLKDMVFEYKMDTKLFVALKKAVDDYINNLNIAQKVMINLWGVEERVNEDLPIAIKQTIEQVFDSLKSNDMQNKIIKHIFASTYKLMDKEIGKLVNIIDELDQNESKEKLKETIHKALSNKNLISPISTEIINLYNYIENLDVNDILNKLSIDTNVASDYISKLIAKLLQKEVVVNNIFNLIEQKVDTLIFNTNISSLSELLSIEQSHKDSISTYLTNKVLTLIKNDIAYIVKAIDLEQVVSQKINLFPLEKVENLISTMIKKHLKWINIFGAILGFLIGAMQLIL